MPGMPGMGGMPGKGGKPRMGGKAGKPGMAGIRMGGISEMPGMPDLPGMAGLGRLPDLTEVCPVSRMLMVRNAGKGGIFLGNTAPCCLLAVRARPINGTQLTRQNFHQISTQ